MDHHVKEYFCQYSDEKPNSHFHQVIALHDQPGADWKTIVSKVPDMPKGWFELAELPSKDRIDFIHDFWLSALP